MRIALLQQNLVVGDIIGNSKKIVRGYKEALSKGAELVVSSELSILGYPPQDFLRKNDIIFYQIRKLREIAKNIREVPIIIGFAEEVTKRGKRVIYNSAAVIFHGKVRDIRRKTLLPNYDVFWESRYFKSYTSIQHPVILPSKKKIGLIICEDLWYKHTVNGDEWNRYDINPLKSLTKNSDTIVTINGSPYYWGKGDIRYRMVSSLAKENKVSIFYSNQVGGNDELIFDGRSFAVNDKGRCIGVARPFVEEILLVDSNETEGQKWISDSGDLEQLKEALVLGLKDYFEKVGNFEGAVIGLSGGIDSAIVAYLAKEALGSKKVLCITMPSPYSSKEGIEDVRTLVRNLGIKLEIIPITKILDSYKKLLRPQIRWSATSSLVEQNIQARIRGMILMAYANSNKLLVLGTGNKSEIAMGYTTLYGDTVSGLGIISDVYKTIIYKLAEYINQIHEIIPLNILNKYPSAELRRGQRDSDDLPPYSELDSILSKYIDEDFDYVKLLKVYGKKFTARVIKQVNTNEYKRRQMAPGLKVTPKAFGSGRRFPIASRTEI